MGNVLTTRDRLLEKLAEGLLNQDEALGLGDRPLYELAIALPTRRACLYLTELLLQQRDALLLPRIIPLGDINAIDEVALEGAAPEDWLPQPQNMNPPINSIERHLVLTALIKNSGFIGEHFPSRHAGLAMALARFVDLTDRFEVDRKKLKTLVPDDLAEHWQKILQYLNLLIEAWPDYLKERKQTDLMVARALALRNFADGLEQSNQPLIIAGSTGSQPATAYLLKKTAAYKKGVVILPSLDLDLPEEIWQNLNPAHPQYGLKTLLEKMELTRKQIKPWETKKETHNKDRAYFIQALFSPTSAIDKDKIKAGIKNIELLEANNNREEASFIAWTMLQKLNDSKGTPPQIALITPDRALARRVRLVLERFGIEIDDEAGVPLTTAPSFIFLKLIVEMVREDFAPLAFLSCLKHPLALAGKKAGQLRGEVRDIEFALRTLSSQIKTNKTGLDFYKNNLGAPLPLLEELRDIFAPFIELQKKGEASCVVLLETHIQCAEKLAASDKESGADLLWGHNEIAATLAEHLRTLYAHKELLERLGAIPLSDYPDLLETLFATATAVRPFRAIGSPLHIWHPTEARLQNTDLVILGGLNDGLWPAHLTPDPWLSRTMRKKLGLESEEAQIGLSAHDFTQGLAYSNVVLTRSKKDADGNPLKPSPWLLRLHNLLKSSKVELKQKNYEDGIENFYQKDLPPLDKSLPQPPLSAKPKQLSASAFTELLNDPYAFYAQRILKLKELNALSLDPQAAERGSLIHNILQKFTEAYPEKLPEDAEQKLLAIGKTFFEENTNPIVRLFWWSQFEIMAKEFIVLEKNSLRGAAVKVFTEIEGSWQTKIAGEAIELKARADRIDIAAQKASIYDYKTGAVPLTGHVPEKAPQLPFEALILKNGGFKDITTNPSKFALAYIALKEKSAAKMLKERPASIEETEQLIKNKLSEYLADTMEWEANENSQYKTYRHLARIKEGG